MTVYLYYKLCTVVARRRRSVLGESPKGFAAGRGGIWGQGRLRGRVGPRADPDPSLWLSCMDQRALKVTRSRVPSKRSGVVGGERKRERRRMSEERGGGSVSTRWTRVGSPLTTQRHQSLCSDRSFLRRDYQFPGAITIY